MAEVRVFTCASSATAPAECAGHVLISGSYGGEYNAWHAARHGLRGVVLNDAGVGSGNAGINGLPYLDRIGLPGATADAQTCHIGDGEHMLAHGVISAVNESARALGCVVGQTVRECAGRMTRGPVIDREPPAMNGGQRYLIIDPPGGRRVICVDAAPMLVDSDAGAIAITGSHAALFRGRPDGLIAPAVHAVFFNDAGVGLDSAGIARLPLLDERRIIAGTVSAASAPIGQSRAILKHGILSHLNQTARSAGAQVGMPLRDFVLKLSGATAMPGYSD
jgi:hypothetical protein